MEAKRARNAPSKWALMCKRGRASSRRRFRENPSSEVSAGLYKNSVSRAKRKGFSMTLTEEWVRERVDGGVCQFTGLPFELLPHSPFMPSIDRIDNSRGYDPDNCRVVLWFINRARGALGDEEFEAVFRLCSNALRRIFRKRSCDGNRP